MLGDAMLDQMALRLAAGAIAVPGMLWASPAQDYPAKPIHLVVGFQPGTAPDLIGRMLGQNRG